MLSAGALPRPAAPPRIPSVDRAEGREAAERVSRQWEVQAVVRPPGPLPVRRGKEVTITRVPFFAAGHPGVGSSASPPLGPVPAPRAARPYVP